MSKLNFGFHKVYGRGRQSITSRHRGGGKRSVYKAIDFFRFLPSIEGKLLEVVQDKYRSGRVGLVGYTNGVVCHMLISDRVCSDTVFQTKIHLEGETDEYDRIGMSAQLSAVKVGSLISNVELNFLKGGVLSRSAGTRCVLLKKYKHTGLVRLPSGRLVLLSLKNICTIGEVGNSHHKHNYLKKAGSSRLLGRRPKVRGVAMNPVDHPHGGRTNGGKVPCTAWGRVAKGVKTSRSKVKKRK